MEQLQPPSELKLTGNVDENWRRFRQRFELYILAIGADTKPDKRKIAILVTVAGPEATEVYNTFTYDDDDDEGKYDVVLSKFEEYCVPRKNETYERYVFRIRMQRDGENFEQFLTDLKTKSQSCNYAGLRESLIRDQIVIGIRDTKVQERLLRDCELTLKKAAAICQAAESAALQMRTLEAGGAMAAAPEQIVHAVRQKLKIQAQRRPHQTAPDHASGDGTRSAKCSRCGYRHDSTARCAAMGRTCYKCEGSNHFASVCRAPGKKKNAVDEVIADGVKPDEFFIDAVDSDNSSKEEWISTLMVNGSLVPFKLDTGAQVNILPLKDFKELKKKSRILDRTVRLRAYNGEPIPTLGVCRAEVTCQGKASNVMFVVVPGDREPLLGLATCERLGLVKRVHVINKEAVRATDIGELVKDYQDVFEGLGCLSVKYNIQLREGAVPVIHASRKVPVALREPLRKELERLVELGVIQRVEEPTEWVSSLVIVQKKNGQLRLCLDPKELNEYIKREHYYIPTAGEVTSEMAGAKWFTKLDASSGFWHIPLEEECMKLTTFNTPFGRFCFRRLPFGIASAPEVFHRSVHQLFEGIDGVRSIHDDIIVWGTTKAEHDARLRITLQRTRESNLRLNFAKCQFATSSLIYMGEKLSVAGVQPDPEKVVALTEMPVPQCKGDLRRYLGMVNFLGKFLPNLSDKSKALRSLLEERTAWQWNSEHQREWDQLLEILTKEPVLKFFDPDRKTKVSADASRDGLGAVLLQLHDESWLPIAYASRALSSAECRYAQIEKEALGMVYACSKFHEFVYGRPTIVETDHKPLVTIAKKNLCELTPRIQRLMLKLQRYDLTIEYLPGKYLVVADALSRAFLKRPADSDTENDVADHVDLVVTNMPVSQAKWAEFAKATEQDEQLQEVAQNILSGWNQHVPCHPYSSFQDELTVVNGVVLRGNRIVVPTEMRSAMLERIHEGHMGIVKCRRRGREHFYWPSMNNDIENVVSRCAVCQKHRSQQQKEPLMPHDVPEEPWSKVAMDLYSLNGKDYLIVVDYTSNFPEVALLSGTTSTQVITRIKSIFARHGIPRTVVSDNGPQFSSREFRDFAEHYEFEYDPSSPLHAQSNGRAEKGVQIVKQLLRKAFESGGDPYLALLNYRSTPLDCGKSPAELLMHRKLRTRLPTVEQERALQPPNLKQKQYYDAGARSLKPLQEHDMVRIRTGKTWGLKAQVLKEVAPRSYHVLTEQGKVFRRNRRDLLKTAESFVDPRIYEQDVPLAGLEADQTGMRPVVRDHPLEAPPSLDNVPPPIAHPVGPDVRRSERSVRKPDRYIENY